MSRPPARGEVDLLRAEVSELKALVARLQIRVAELAGASSEDGSAELIPAAAATTNGPSASSSTARGVRVEVVSLEERLDSRYWIVVRDFEGVIYAPPRVYTHVSDCKALVKRGSECSSSIFVGLPAKEDVVLALEAGDYGRRASGDECRGRSGGRG